MRLNSSPAVVRWAVLALVASAAACSSSSGGGGAGGPGGSSSGSGSGGGPDRDGGVTGDASSHEDASGPSSSGGSGSGSGGSSSGGSSGSSSSGGSSGSSSSGGSSGCGASESVCPKGCADLMTDPDNCGSCENVCPSTPAGTTATCVKGSCTATCAVPSETYCNATAMCVSTSTDPDNCGGCQQACTTSNPCATPSCSGGSCGTTPVADGKYCDTGSTSSQACLKGACAVVHIECDQTSAGDWIIRINGDEATATACGCSGTSMTTQNGVYSACSACLAEPGTVLCFK